MFVVLMLLCVCLVESVRMHRVKVLVYVRTENSHRIRRPLLTTKNQIINVCVCVLLPKILTTYRALSNVHIYSTSRQTSKQYSLVESVFVQNITDELYKTITDLSHAMRHARTSRSIHALLTNYIHGSI